MRYGKLDADHKVIAATPHEVGELLGNLSRQVGKFTNGDVEVSTVFLGLNHGDERGDKWFETMVFGGPLNGEQERYETWVEAEAGHAAVIARVLAMKTSS